MGSRIPPPRATGETGLPPVPGLTDQSLLSSGVPGGRNVSTGTAPVDVT